MIPYGRQSINDDDVEAVVAALKSDWLTTGPAVDAFEADVASVAGSPLPAVSVTSGTAALHVAYSALGVGRGSEVLTTPLTFAATASTAAILGARIVFVDVTDDTGNIDPQAVDAAASSSTNVVAGVDFAGNPVDADRLQEIAKGVGAHFLEDAAHSLGSTLQHRPVGSLADITTFSFFPTKNATTAEGGAVVTPHPELAARARSFRNHGLVRDPEAQRWPDEGPWHQEVAELGLNYRLPDILAALGSSQLARLSDFKSRRQELWQRYNEAFTDVDSLTLPIAASGSNPMWHLYTLRTPAERRRSIFEELRAAGIGVQVNYMPVYWHPAFADLGYKRGMCPIAEDWYRREISLPMHPALTDDQLDQTISAVLTAVAE